jgi:ATP-binding cassette subfamily B multidrug efflux pump
VVSSFFGLLVPWMTRAAIDGIGSADGGGRLSRAVSFMLLFAFLHGAFRYLARRGLLATARRVERRLRDDLFGRVARLPMSFFHATPTGDVMSRMTNDVSAVWLFLGPGLLTLAGTVVSYVLALVFMIRLSPLLTLVTLAFAPVVVLLSREYGRAFHRQHRGVQESLSGMNGFLQENVTGIRLVKAFGLEEREEEKFAERCREYYAHNISVSRTSAAFHGAIGFAAGAGVALVLGVGGWLVVRKEMSLGGFVAFNAYLAMLAFPTMAMGWVINLLQRGGSAMGRINEFLRLPAEPDVLPPAPAGERPAADAPFLVVDNLSFSYPGGGRGKVLDGLSFSLRRGEVVGLVGPTGSGKSTLFSLILRLAEKTGGTLRVEGRDVGEIPLPELRRKIALVGQDPFLFSDTILENVCFGLPSPDETAARKAAGAARFLAEIEEMPNGFDTVIGERGISLSGGQKQRVTIARALCVEADALLLDDALSSVDSRTEQEVFREILANRGGRTVLFSTHRMTSLFRCDRVLVMSGGRIVEEGTHDELMSLRGVYFDLYSRQMLSRELESSS